MKNRKPWLEKFDYIRSTILAFYIAVVLLCIEAIRFLICTFFKPLPKEEVLAFFIPWGIAIILLTLLIKGFSNNLK